MYNKNKDLTQIFDSQWKANHNDDIKKKQDHEIDFINRMFNVKEENKDQPSDAIRIKNNMDKLNNLNRQIQNKRMFK